MSWFVRLFMLGKEEHRDSYGRKTHVDRQLACHRRSVSFSIHCCSFNTLIKQRIQKDSGQHVVYLTFERLINDLNWSCWQVSELSYTPVEQNHIWYGREVLDVERVNWIQLAILTPALQPRDTNYRERVVMECDQ